jgi:hypothetical protein
MMEKTTTNRSETKKPYAKPLLRRVNLRPEEAVLGNCKTSGGSGPTGGNCIAVGACNSLGS